MTTSCPFLGIKDDPYTSLAYADPANYCQAVSPGEPVDLTHQARYCLSGRYSACPVNAAKAGQGLEVKHLPRGIRGTTPTGSGMRLSRGWLLLLLVIALVPVTFWLYSLYAPPSSSGARFSESNGETIPIQVSETPPPTITPTNIIAVGGMEETPTDDVPISTLSPTPTLGAELAEGLEQSSPTPEEVINCNPPADWVVYIVKSGDTLFGIALSHGTTTAELRAANCLKGGSNLVTGQYLFVPNKPSPTVPLATKPPLPTYTPTQTNPKKTNAPAPTDTPIPVKPTDTQPPAPSNTPLPQPTDPPLPTAAPTEPPSPPTEPPPEPPEPTVTGS